MRRRDPSSRIGGARAWARVEVMEAVEEVTLWKALGRDRCREGCFGREGRALEENEEEEGCWGRCCCGEGFGRDE